MVKNHHAILTDEQIEKLEKILAEIPEYFDDATEIVCPHCGENMNFESGDTFLYSEDTYTITCSHCEKRFELSGSMSFSWYTEKVDG